MSEQVMKWGLLCLMAATVPVLYYMFVIGGFLPLIAIVALSFTGVWGFVLFNAVHLLIYGALFYSTALVAISFLPVYGVGHHESQSVDLYRLFNGLLGDAF